MPSIVDVYTNGVYENLKPVRANWQPLVSVELGTVGTLDGQIFKPSGDLKSDFGIDIGTIAKGSNVTHIYFTTSRNSSVKLNAAGAGDVPGANIKASIEVNFSNSSGVFFNGAGCVQSSISDKILLGRKIMQLDKARKWNTDLLIVVDYIEVSETTIAVSGSSSSSIVFEAGANVPTIDLANASLGLAVKSSSNIGYQLTSSQPIRPLISLAKVQTSWFGPDTWNSAMALGAALDGERDLTRDRMLADKRADPNTRYFGTFY